MKRHNRTRSEKKKDTCTRDSKEWRDLITGHRFNINADLNHNMRMIGSSSNRSRHVPHDIIFEILSRTTFETLDACTHVSKEWRDLITDKRFTDFYQKKHNIDPYREKEFLNFSSDQSFVNGKRNKIQFAGYFLQCGREHNPFSIFVPLNLQNFDTSIHNWSIPQEMKILASCRQGIVFCCDKYRNYFVGKPSVKKWITMPKPNDFDGSRGTFYGIVVLGYSPLWYKVVKLDLGTRQFYYQIFDSKLRKWVKAGVVLCDHMRPIIASYRPTVCVSGCIYWQIINGVSLVAFKGLTDSFSIVDLPAGITNQNVQIHELNGRLRFSHMIRPFGRDPAIGTLVLWEQYSISYNWHRKRVVHEKHLKRRGGQIVGLYTEVQEQDAVVMFSEWDFFDLSLQIFPFGL